MDIGQDARDMDPALNASLPPLPGRLKITLLLAFWTAVAVIATTTAFIALRGDTPQHWFNTFQPMIIYYYSWAGMSVLIFTFVSRPMPTLPDKLKATGLCLLVLVSMLFLMPLIIHGDDWQDWFYGSRAPGFQTLGVAIFLFLFVGSLALKYYRQGIERERSRLVEVERASRLVGELTQARLDALIMQVNPHFLFNALNSIGALIETERNSDAYRTTERLGSLLRQTLERAEQKTTSLREEVAYIENYIALEQTRFGDRMTFERAVDPAAMTIDVLVFILQPIVENAIKHGVSKSTRMVNIRLSAKVKSEHLLLTVLDDGPGLQANATPREGVGLRNTRSRLELVYGPTASLEISTGNSGGTRVEICLPAQNKST